MRDYFSETNLKKAVLLSLVVTAMSVPRIMSGGLPLALFIPMTFVGMTFVAGAATAWSRSAGMAGLFPSRAAAWRGVGMAVAAALVLAPIGYLFFDPVFRGMVHGTGDRRLLELQYPSTPGSVLALVLWSAGFELVFFCAAAVSFFARWTGLRGLAVGAAVVFRTMVAWRQMSGAGIEGDVILRLAGVAATAAVTCVLFVRAGLPAPAVFLAALDLRFLLPPHQN